MTYFSEDLQEKRGSTHPSVEWAKWYSDDQCFKYWDKEKGENVEIKLPDDFIVVAEWNSIWGYVSALNTWVRSNEVFNFNDPFIVRKNDGSIWIQGTWNEIKDQVKGAKAKLQKHIHYTTPDSLELKTLIISWAALTEWINSLNKNKTATPGTHKIKLKKIEKGKVGKIEYSYPVFENSKPLDANDKNLQKAMWLWLQKHYEETKWDVEKELEKKGDSELPF